MTSSISRAPSRPSSSPRRILRPPSPSDAAGMWELARGAVDENSPYAYLMMCEYFADACVVAEDEGRLVGFVTGFRPPADPDTHFVWQIVVDPATRGTGLGGQLLDACAASGPRPVRWLEATVTADNEASSALFRAFARRHDAPCAEETAFPRELFPPAAGAHESEIRFRIGPLGTR